MTPIADWLVVVGALLVSMSLISSLVERLPVSAAMLYLVAGFALGPAMAGMIDVDPLRDALLIEVLTEIALAVSLFSVGLHLRVPMRWRAWRVPLRLAGPAMIVGIAVIAAASHLLLDMSWPIAVVLGSIIAPTDPVLASDVQVEHPGDRDVVRFGLTAEGGINDGLAMPGILIGAAMLTGEPFAAWGARALGVDLLWLLACGFAIGWAAGWAVGRLVAHLRSRHGLHVGIQEFLSLGVIAITYGVASYAHGSSFLAVFAAGLALRQVERYEADVAAAQAAGGRPEECAKPAGEVVHALLDFNVQVERIAELAMVTLLGALLHALLLDWAVLAVAAVALFLARPLGVGIALAGAGVAPTQRRLISWFGVRGIGSLYYLSFAIRSEMLGSSGRLVASAALATVVMSIVLHGVSATPLMARYARWRERAGRGGGARKAGRRLGDVE